jgi:hypothetical protein
MKLYCGTTTLVYSALLALCSSSTDAFNAPSLWRRRDAAGGAGTLIVRTTSTSINHMVTMAESGVPPATSDSSDVAEYEIPTNLPSDCGMDYVPLATMLATGQLAEADQVRCYCWGPNERTNERTSNDSSHRTCGGLFCFLTGRRFSPCVHSSHAML